MHVETRPTTPAQSPSSPDDWLLAFLQSRSLPCPRCAYDLRDIATPRCPECGEPLILKVGSPRARFGWLVLAMAPGCFSGVAALFVLVPIIGSIYRGMQGAPWPIMLADAFGFTSAAGVWLMYRHRQRLMSLPTRRQIAFAAAVWSVHVAMLALVLLALYFRW